MEYKSNEIKNAMFSWVLSEIVQAEHQGVRVKVDGKFYSSEEADELQQVMEEHYYMKSYTGDENGKIVQIDFDHIVDM